MRRADEALVRALFEEHGRAMLAYATRLTGDRPAAEDVVQEALIRAWRNADSLVNGRGSVRSWLLTIVRNLVRDQIRARRARPTEVEETPDAVPLEPDHADQVVDSVVVLAALDDLSAEHREVLAQVYLHGRTVHEAARRLGIPPGTVKSRSYYGLRALRKQFQALRPDVEGAA
jgi:RNA polymerase sigma-70 factor (ECF subfamily)